MVLLYFSVPVYAPFVVALTKLFGRKVALITGGARGIGRGIALALAKAGADLAVNYRKNEKAAEETVSLIQGMGRKAIAVQGDISNYEAAKELMRQAFQVFGRIDILVNSAGIASRGYFVEKTDVDELESRPIHQPPCGLLLLESRPGIHASE